MGSWSKLEIGKKYTGFIDKDRKGHKDQPFVVLREATWQEWYECLEDGEAKIVVDSSEHHMKESKKGNFYEISMD